MAYKQNRSVIAGTSGHRSALKQRTMKSEMKPLPKKTEPGKTSSDIDAESMKKKVSKLKKISSSKAEMLKKTPLKQKGEIVYKNGKKFYKASDGTLHTGQVSDYETEKANDKKAKAKKKKDVPVKPTDKDMKKYSDLEKYDDDNPTGKAKPPKKKKSPLKQAKTKEDYMALGFNQKDADKMMADGAISGVLTGGVPKKKKIAKKQSLNVKKGSAADKKSKLTASKSPMKQLKDLRKKDKYVDLDKGADMPVKKSGFGPRRGNVPNPEMKGMNKKIKPKKVMNDGPKTNVSGVKNPGNWQPANRVKSDAEKKVIAKKKEYNAMTPAQKKTAQDKANDKADKFHKRGKYKVK